jgi:2-polyprenyl-3-methyl-5-hydroxy-6-metoxy-1,4-benzoquinol methylase
MSLSQTERETYREMWAVDPYRESGSPGVWCADIFASWAAPKSTVLDAGCGLGVGGQALEERGFRVYYSDLSLVNESLAEKFQPACLWSEPEVRALRRFGRIEYVYCTDVLEHIPTPFAMLAAANLINLATKGVFFSIGLQPDHFGVWVGKTLHHTVQSFTQWRDQLRELGNLVDARDLGGAGIYMVTPRV